MAIATLTVVAAHVVRRHATFDTCTCGGSRNDLAPHTRFGTATQLTAHRRDPGRRRVGGPYATVWRVNAACRISHIACDHTHTKPRHTATKLTRRVLVCGQLHGRQITSYCPRTCPTASTREQSEINLRSVRDRRCIETLARAWQQEDLLRAGVGADGNVAPRRRHCAAAAGRGMRKEHERAAPSLQEPSLQEPPLRSRHYKSHRHYRSRHYRSHHSGAVSTGATVGAWWEATTAATGEASGGRQGCRRVCRLRSAMACASRMADVW